MASMQEIKIRMKSIEETRKITNAMYMISSMEMRKAKENFEKTKSFFQAVRTEIKRIFRTVDKIESPYIYPLNMNQFVNGTYGILLITSDKGLAGTYNLDAIKECNRIIEEHPDAILYVIGEFGRQYYRRRNIQIVDEFRFTPQHPTLEEAREISAYLLDEYDSGRIKKLFVVYTNLGDHMKQDVESTRLLPLHREYFDLEKQKEEIAVEHAFEFWPSVEVILSQVIVTYVQGFIYGALVDSFCSEENSRIQAMAAANDNAKELLSKLSNERNRLRQEKITAEILEISSGAKAQAKEKKQRI